MADRQTYAIPETERDERHESRSRFASRIADIWALVLQLVPPEHHADLLYQVTRLEQARMAADDALTASWEHSVQRAYLAGHTDAWRTLSGEAAETPAAEIILH